MHPVGAVNIVIKKSFELDYLGQRVALDARIHLGDWHTRTDVLGLTRSKRPITALISVRSAGGITILFTSQDIVCGYIDRIIFNFLSN